MGVMWAITAIDMEGLYIKNDVWTSGRARNIEE
jgi:hypothetical protein